MANLLGVLAIILSLMILNFTFRIWMLMIHKERLVAELGKTELVGSRCTRGQILVGLIRDCFSLVPVNIEARAQCIARNIVGDGH